VIKVHFTKVGLNGNHDWVETLKLSPSCSTETRLEVIADRAVYRSDLPIDGVTAVGEIEAPHQGQLLLRGCSVGRFSFEQVTP